MKETGHVVNPEAFPSPAARSRGGGAGTDPDPPRCDAAVAVACWHAAGIRTHLCTNMEEVCAAMDRRRAASPMNRCRLSRRQGYF
jgi:hypothetical protein